MAIRDENILFFDGACGTNLQRMEIPPSAWEGRDGCNEFLNVSAPEVIREWHASFLSAGATVLETNTFGANAIVLAEYGLADRVAEINRAAVGNAREAIRRHGGPAYVAGSIGPTTKLPSLGHIAFEPMAAAFAEQARALVEAGADLLILETCQDLLQIKIALVSCFGTLEQMKRDVPVMVSITIENTGTMLVGTDVAAALAAIEPFPVFSIGLNCATGPEGMTSHLRYLCRHYRGRVSCIPNAGIPQVRDGKTHYPLSARGVRRAAFRLRPGRRGLDRRRVLRHHAGAHPETPRGARRGRPGPAERGGETVAFQPLPGRGDPPGDSPVPHRGAVQRERLEAVPGPAPRGRLPGGAAGRS